MNRLGPPPKDLAALINWLGQLENRLRWNDATLENSWANVGGAYYDAQYTKDTWGLVKLRGRIDTGTSATTALTLPAEFRPNATIEFICAGEAGGSPAVAYVTIDSSGVLTPTISGASIEVSLDGIAFLAEK